MLNFLKALPFLLVGIFFCVIGILLGRYIFPSNMQSKTTVTEQSILQKVSTQGFLVTHNVISEEKVINKIDKGSQWSNFWWGHEVEARATMQVAYGIDLSKLTEKNIKINNSDKTVCFEYPTPAIQSVALVGDIEVEQKSGILKKILENDDNEDFNLALDLLETNAKKSTNAIDGISENSMIQTDNTINFLLSGTGYSINAECR